jgi:integrase
MGKPYFKQSHKAWYANINGKTVKLGRTEAEAFAEYARKLAPAAEPAADNPAPAAASPAPVTGPTLGEIIAKWCAHIEANCPKATVQSYCRYARRWASHHGSRAAASIIGADVTEAKDKLYPKVATDGGRAYSGACRKQHVKVAKQIFAWAKEQGLIAVNTLEGYRSKGDSYGKRDVDITGAQFERLLAGCDDPAFRDVLTILYDTGCRPKEAFDATAKHLDREARCLRYAKGKMGKPRVICLTDRAFEILARLADQHPEGALLRNRIGSKWSIGSADARLQVLHARTGVKATCYVFRHAFCTRMVKEGKNLVTLQQQMGHSSLRMISEVYAHVGGDTANIRASLFGAA